jgi:hypothetical protein
MSSYDETCIVLDSSGVPKPCSPANHGSLGFVFSEGVCREPTTFKAVEDRACRVRVLGGSMFFLAREFPR